ncbi:MAG: 23S rRNA (pseudouridine(1915)-N(3))-methyltransferase RlmH [Clostridia bacterium]|nr:23S rRNA (pseudouridine(1915)-N(3))-methyltransferase RlmH [Clostridia bacterium]
MINISIIALGKLKEAYLRDAMAEYSKRLSADCRFNVIELNPKKISDNPSQTEIESALREEAKLIKSKIPSNSAVFAMCIEGKQLSSEKLCEKLQKTAVSGKNNAVFIIGSSYGLADEIKALADFKLSMSEMTFPHQLARVMLAEQIYRCVQIEKGTKYHK